MPKLIYIEWKPYYSVGHEELDHQHRRIIDLINELYDALQLEREKQVIGPLLDQLLDYTRTHFDSEERIFRESAYGGFAEHKLIHDEMTRKTVELHRHWDAVNGSELLTFLKSWWVDHICGKDKEYSPYLQLESAQR